MSVLQNGVLHAILDPFYMTFNRLVKYESSIGGVSLKAILSDNDGKSYCNLLRLHLAYFSVITTKA